MYKIPHGYFIAVEGVDFAGKSTLVPALTEWLKGCVDNVVSTGEPGGTPFANAIRAVFKGDVSQHVSQTAMALLVNAARHDHVLTVIIPALANQSIVVSDRYVCSTYMYQHDATELDAICEIGTAGLVPDLTILLDIDYLTYTQRMPQRRREHDHLDCMDVETFTKRRDGMVEFNNTYPFNTLLIDANSLTPTEVLDRCVTCVTERFKAICQ